MATAFIKFNALQFLIKGHLKIWFYYLDDLNNFVIFYVLSIAFNKWRWFGKHSIHCIESFQVNEGGHIEHLSLHCPRHDKQLLFLATFDYNLCLFLQTELFIFLISTSVLLFIFVLLFMSKWHIRWQDDQKSVNTYSNCLYSV